MPWGNATADDVDWDALCLWLQVQSNWKFLSKKASKRQYMSMGIGRKTWGQQNAGCWAQIALKLAQQRGRQPGADLQPLRCQTAAPPRHTHKASSRPTFKKRFYPASVNPVRQLRTNSSVANIVPSRSLTVEHQNPALDSTTRLIRSAIVSRQRFHFCLQQHMSRLLLYLSGIANLYITTALPIPYYPSRMYRNHFCTMPKEVRPKPLQTSYPPAS